MSRRRNVPPFPQTFFKKDKDVGCRFLSFCSLLVQHKETLVLLLEIEIRILDLIREEEKRGSTEEDWCSWSTTTYSSLVTSIII